MKLVQHRWMGNDWYDDKTLTTVLRRSIDALSSRSNVHRRILNEHTAAMGNSPYDEGDEFRIYYDAEVFECRLTWIKRSREWLLKKVQVST